MTALPPVLARKLKKQHQFLISMTSIEQKALDLCRPVDLRTFEPEIINCPSGITAQIASYWRVVLSSEKQAESVSQGYRTHIYLVRDKVGGGFLGTFAITDLPMSDPGIDRHIGWSDEPGRTRLDHQNQAAMLKRCLPLYEFGGMLGGKLLALSATSREVIRSMELKYSFQYWWLFIRTLHGKSSQYNRLHTKGIIDLGVDAKGHGLYCKELRKDATAHIQTGAALGKSTCEGFADLTGWWRERWLLPRLKSTGHSGIITPDPLRYRLSDMLDAKRKTPADMLGVQSIANEDPDHE